MAAHESHDAVNGDVPDVFRQAPERQTRHQRRVPLEEVRIKNLMSAGLNHLNAGKTRSKVLCKRGLKFDDRQAGKRVLGQEGLSHGTRPRTQFDDPYGTRGSSSHRVRQTLGRRDDRPRGAGVLEHL